MHITFTCVVMNIIHSYVNAHLSICSDSFDSPKMEQHSTTTKRSIYSFIRKSEEEFVCPVTSKLMLQPHLTSCCSKYLSEEAVTIGKKKRGTCPLCNSKNWSVELDKNFQEKICSMEVICPHQSEGCTWRGKLSSLESHIMSCSKDSSPILPTDPVSL